jgi:hypothetical protein
VANQCVGDLAVGAVLDFGVVSLDHLLNDEPHSFHIEGIFTRMIGNGFFEESMNFYFYIKIDKK